ncbi:MAG: efflux RND transporter periplasmic adaptor subunit [Luminiphilus sp.]|jgi:RND family efflux transporter MFP subunit|nr:efflux RND transporter periplasmic adaptor subunit [Luminiphilus sp.]
MSDTPEVSTVANRLSLRKLFIAGVATLTGLTLTWVVLTAKSEPQAGPPPDRPAPMVTVLEAAPATRQLLVHTQGTIDAKRRVDLVAQVTGKVVEVSDAFADGGFFEKDDVLLSIERDDYEFALARAESALAQAEQRLAEERGRSRQARREWRELGSDEANDLFLRKPQLRAAELAVKAAQADISAAELALDRTIIRAPFDGRIQQKRVDIGQFVGNGTMLAQIYALEALELRLPLSDAQLALLPAQLLTSSGGLVGSSSYVSVNIGGRSWQFPADIKRSEAELDRRSRVATVIAEFPGSPDLENGRPALTPGMFARAEIVGRPVDGVIELTNAALSPDGHVLIVNQESRLERRDVAVINREGRSVWVSGLAAGDLVVAQLNNTLFPGLRVTTEVSVY